MKLVSTGIKFILSQRMKKVEHYLRYPAHAQEIWFEQLLKKGKKTSFGKALGFDTIRNIDDFQQKVPLQDYNSLKPFIDRMLKDEANVLWPERIKWFSKSSGTTNDKSKYLPVSKENLKKCQLQGSYDLMAMWFDQFPNSKVFENSKSVIMGGSISRYGKGYKARIGDVSAVMLKNLPFYAEYYICPDIKTALLSDWEEKLETLASSMIGQNITNIGGVPTWTLILFKRILELSGKASLIDVFPNFEMYAHGGVDFAPYKTQFQSLFGSDKIKFRNSYNASEGFFGAQQTDGDDSIALFLDNGVFYEFIPLEELDKDHPKAYTVENVSIGVDYAVVITTNAGLWRYQLGDTVQFTSLKPHKIRITGRTKHFINVFGEEVMVWNTDKALSEVCASFGVEIADYTVAPVFFEAGDSKGGHEWAIEFRRAPTNLPAFQRALDLALQAINSDYASKRYKSIALEELRINVVPVGVFRAWMKERGKLGGQNKVPPFIK